MRICFPTETNQGLSALLYGHFGSAPFFTLADTETGILEVRDNQGQVHAHGACHPVGALEGLGIQAVVCGGMGLRALQKLEEAGIEVYRSGALTVEEALREIREGKAERLSAEGACAHHKGCR
ncbi:MAG TPA: NifB/NifX family molybdenum-iron cluster-binding protein [Candidatus Latescibacteria bacterium]|nr:NifB/NifX family molybdenum-iron cluster-binding protein [Candidatus Latescibacterota bacterium]